MDVSTIWDFCGEVVGTIRPKTGYVPATVTRIDNDGTVWVTTGDGGEAPASTCAADVSVGDVVSVSWSGAQMGVVGNASDPAAGASTVRAVRKAAESAAKVASGAQKIADAIGQHFWADDNGAHVSTEKDNPTGERNILMNSLGILLRQGSSWLASFSDSAVAFYDGLGNAASNVVAQFGADGAVIGRSGESHMELDYHSMRMLDKEGNTYFHVSDLRDASGNVDVSTTRIGNGSTTVFRFDYTVDLSTVAVTVDGAEVTSGWTATNPEGPLYNETQVTFDAAPASGSVVVLTGTVTDATVTAQMKAYTLGTRAGTGGAYSLVTGTQGTASGARSQAHGIGTRATHPNEVALGRYNTGAGALSGRWADSFNGVALIIGNGTSDSARSNALEVAWDGTVTAAGEITGASTELAVTLASGVTADTHAVRRSGKQVTVYVVGLNLAAELASHGTATVGTVPEGARPPYTVYAQLAGYNDGGSYVSIAPNGAVTVSNQSGAAIPTTRELGFTVSYVM